LKLVSTGQRFLQGNPVVRVRKTGGTGFH
jgi:hypothetical protein